MVDASAIRAAARQENNNTKIMKKNSLAIRICLAGVAGWASTTGTSQAQTAVATISDVPSGGSFDYTIELQNTGTEALNSFWYGWTTSGNNLPSTPTDAGNLSAWANDVSGNSIMWINHTGTALGPGQTATFTFVSVDPPSAMTTAPAGESVAYVGGIDFSQGRSGDSTGVFSPALVPTPEPSTLSLLAVSALGFSGVIRRKLRG
jgi:hypothetical protein